MQRIIWPKGLIVCLRVRIIIIWYNIIVVVKISYLSATRARTMNLPQRYTHILLYTAYCTGWWWFLLPRPYLQRAHNFFYFFDPAADPSWKLQRLSQRPSRLYAYSVQCCGVLAQIYLYIKYNILCLFKTFIRAVRVQNDFQRYNFTMNHFIKYCIYTCIIRSLVHVRSYLTFSRVHFTGQPAFTHYSAPLNTKSVCIIITIIRIIIILNIILNPAYGSLL